MVDKAGVKQELICRYGTYEVGYQAELLVPIPHKAHARCEHEMDESRPDTVKLLSAGCRIESSLEAKP